MNRRIAVLLTAAFCTLALPVVAQESTPETTPPAEATAEATATPLPYQIFVPEVLNQIPHSVTDFTQGLVWNEGQLFQSAGQYGESRLQELDPETGDVIREVDGTPAVDAQVISDVIQGKKPGDTIRIEVTREGRGIGFEATLGLRPENPE